MLLRLCLKINQSEASNRSARPRYSARATNRTFST